MNMQMVDLLATSFTDINSDAISLTQPKLSSYLLYGTNEAIAILYGIKVIQMLLWQHQQMGLCLGINIFNCIIIVIAPNMEV